MIPNKSLNLCTASAISVLLLFFVRVSLADLSCSDINTDACALMHHDKPDLCNSTLGDTACPRYCGKCPLECFTCSNLVQDLSQCAPLTCDIDQVCHSMEVTDFDQSHGFRGGCINKELCVPHSLGPQLFGRSSSTVHINCCDTDRCNGLSNPPTTRKSTTIRTTTLKVPHSQCHDIRSSCTKDRCGPHMNIYCRKTCGFCCENL